jgi:hypothetical protein
VLWFACLQVVTGLTIKEIIRLLLSSLPQGPALQQQLLLLALGHASSEHYPLLLEEVGVLMEEYMRPAKAQRRQGRPDEVSTGGVFGITVKLRG